MLRRSRAISTYTQASSELAFLFSVRSLASFFEDVARDYNRSQYVAYSFLLRAVEASCVRRLDNNSSISPTSDQRELVERARALRQDIRSMSPPRARTASEERFLLAMRERGLNARKQEHVARCVWALVEASEKSWWPMFVTLTVSPENYDAVFRRDSVVWKNYIRSIRRAIGRRLGMSKREAEKSEIHKYFAVVERGEANGRLHVHVLHLCRELPVCARDPNAGRSVPDRREVVSWRQFWPYGFVSAVPVRTGPVDCWARAGWRWPVKERVPGVYEPYRTAGNVGVARYIGKYLHKQRYCEKEYWRCRMTRNFGLERIVRKISPLKSRRLLQLINGVLPQVRMSGQAVPSRIIKRVAITELFRRNPRRLVRAIGTLDPAPSLIQKLRTTGFMRTRSSSATVVSEWFDNIWEIVPCQRTVSGLL